MVVVAGAEQLEGDVRVEGVVAGWFLDAIWEEAHGEDQFPHWLMTQHYCAERALLSLQAGVVASS